MLPNFGGATATRPRIRAYLVALIARALMTTALAACSDSSGPTPGTFRAQLSGAHTAVLSGSAFGEINFVGVYPDHHYAIRMHAESGDTVRTIAFRCHGQTAPVGTYELSLSGEGCYAWYNRVLVDEDGRPVILEEADATTGQLTVESSTGGQLPGAFSFSGPLVEAGEMIGTVQVTGNFSARQLD